MNGIRNLFLQRLDNFPPYPWRKKNVLFGTPVIVIKNDIRMYLLRNHFDIFHFIVCDHPEQPCHFIRIFQIIHQRLFHPHQMMGALKQTAGTHKSHKFFFSVYFCRFLFHKSPVQMFQIRHRELLFPLFNIFDNCIFLIYPWMGAGRAWFKDIDCSPGILMLQPILRTHVPHKHRIRNKHDGVHQITIKIRLLPVINCHCIFPQIHIIISSFISFFTVPIPRFG